MTTLGKIFAILNLVVSLLVAALLVMVFVARGNYQEAFEKMKAQAAAAEASASAFYEEKLQADRSWDTRVKKVEADMKSVRDTLTSEQRAHQVTTALLNQEKAKFNKNNVEVTANTEEMKRRELEIKTLAEQLTKRDQEINKLVQLNKDLSDQKVSFELRASSTQNRNEQLLADNARLTKLLDKAKNGNGNGNGRSSLVDRNPPAEDVEGIIKAVDPSTKYVTLSLGSDHGLSQGNTMDVYRLSPAPLYLGTIKILNARATESVAVPVGATKEPLRVGDRISSNVVRSR